MSERYIVKNLSPPEKELVSSLYREGLSRQEIGTSIRQQGIRIDNNSIQNVINDLKKDLNTTEEHKQSIERLRKEKLSYSEKIEFANTLIESRANKKLIKKAKQIIEIRKEKLKLPLEVKLQRQGQRAFKEHMRTTTNHGSEIMAVLSYPIPVIIQSSNTRYANRNHLRNINSLHELQGIYKRKENLEDEKMVAVELQLFDTISERLLTHDEAVKILKELENDD